MLHIIQNDPEVPPGVIVDYLTIPYRIHHPYLGESLPETGISALIVMGGAMGVNDDREHPFLVDVKQLIRQVVTAGIPYLGICLGGQLLAAALGAEVVSGRWEELGSLPVNLTEEGKGDLLFREVGEQFTTFQWHHDSFDIPAGAVLLASSTACPHQAFRMGECAWGIQFHPEVTEEIIRCWSAWDSSLPATTEEIVTEFMAGSQRYYFTASQMMRNFLLSVKLTWP